MRPILTILTLLSSLCFAAELTLAAGAFRFNATDFYYPDFYLEAGYRAEAVVLTGTYGNSL